MKLSLAFPISLESDVYALQSIRSYCQGKLTLWAWASRGYCTCSDVARWFFQGDEDKAKELLSPCERGAFTEYVKLKTLPALHILGEENGQPVKLPEGFLTGEQLHVWFVDQGAGGMVPLPHWCSMAIECTISLWRNEQKVWNDKIAARFPKALPPAQKKHYDQWLENSTRRLVMDQQSKSQIKHPASCSKSHLMKHGVLLEPRIHEHHFFHNSWDAVSNPFFSCHRHLHVFLAFKTFPTPTAHTYIHTYIHTYVLTYIICTCVYICTYYDRCMI